ncbi:hypothetical protein Pmar_PMAR012010 [Perkinsus marinus ATCC 50983]|uniref:Uncharacterized protein n=1 Tax=Perkinsus marinus (strain ATCC 50983 / TXsc) TaxID=423536 RepID=C5LW65_PERM5|nr:hypothetical protein Pmar_PMAR012010 [Perkinsus marinus ATCC 50983]EEQ99002.1 hypothetical protein Pmar_PMAR012010 [Perkinsus marinus ATCC 50983]|eukprot:XP_002766285.1 hypothetical protein Pmar_PMAR012010 [Perkinsus marinus ATCC 50983]
MDTSECTNCVKFINAIAPLWVADFRKCWMGRGNSNNKPVPASTHPMLVRLAIVLPVLGFSQDSGDRRRIQGLTSTTPPDSTTPENRQISTVLRATANTGNLLVSAKVEISRAPSMFVMSPPVCLYGDQPCGDVSTCQAPIVGFTTFDLDGDQHVGPSAACDLYCQGLNDDESYCKHWQNPAVCHSGDQPCGPTVCDPIDTTAVFSTTAVSTAPVSSSPTTTLVTTLAPTTTTDVVTTPSAGTSVSPTTVSAIFGGDSDPTTPESSECDLYCKSLNGDDSYCKSWLSPPVCQKGNQRCDPSTCIVETTEPIFGGDAETTPVTSTTDDSAACDHYCKLLNGEASYCKQWQTPAVCLYGDQPCDDANVCRSPIEGITTADLDGDNHTGESSACDAYCKGLNGVTSYCKYWQHPAVCLDGDQPCGPSVCDPSTTTSSLTSEAVSTTTSSEATTPTTITIPTPATTTVATAVSSTTGSDSAITTTTAGGPLFGGDADTSTSPVVGEGYVCDYYCQLLNGPESYCKFWQSPAVCQYGDQPCGDVTTCSSPIIGTSTYDLVGDQHGGSSSACDSYCQGLNGDSSYCKYWQNPAVCLGGDQPCGPSICDPTTSTAPDSTSSTPPSSVSSTTSGTSQSVATTSLVFGGDSDSTIEASNGCDTYCKALNDESSYCKYWLDPPVCQSGDQVCDPSVC